MHRTKLGGVATAMTAAALIASPATAHADDSVPTTDEVVAIMAELTDPNIPAANKANIVTPGFAPDEAGTIDDHLHRTDASGLLPYNFVVTDIQPAPANLAGATVTVSGSFHQRSAPQPIVLVDQGGHWNITHDTAKTALDNFWYNAQRCAVIAPMLESMKIAVTGMLLAASLAGVAAPVAHADDVPSVDQVVAVTAGLTDPNILAANKGNIVTPGFTPDEAGTIDDHLNRMNAGGLLPLNFVVTDIEPAPADLAGATVATTGSLHQWTPPGAIVLADHGGHWSITHDTAMTALEAFWYNDSRRIAPHTTP